MWKTRWVPNKVDCVVDSVPLFGQDDMKVSHFIDHML